MYRMNFVIVNQVLLLEWWYIMLCYIEKDVLVETLLPCINQSVIPAKQVVVHHCMIKIKVSSSPCLLVYMRINYALI